MRGGSSADRGGGVMDNSGDDIEYFPLRAACRAGDLPTMADYPQLRAEPIEGVCLLGKPLSGYLTFCDRIPAGEAIDADCTATVLVPPELYDRLAARFPAARLIGVSDPRAVFIDTLAYLQMADLLGLTSLMPRDSAVSAGAIIGERAVIEPGVRIDAGTSVGSGTVVRRGTWLKAGVAIGENCVIGGLGINAYLGKDGRRRGFPHVAGVIVAEGVSVGSGCVVVRGILGSTRIGANSIIGNLCNIGHGVEIGENVWMSAGTLVGGHVRMEDGATVAMGCTIRDNIAIGAAANIGMGSVVTKDVAAGKSVFGNPARIFAAIAAGPAR
jgi:UDP-3-O-[3-hydroxymyristoyl] glucosamine N-acyltransferase